jgi:hypothetical protein
MKKTWPRYFSKVWEGNINNETLTNNIYAKED